MEGSLQAAVSRDALSGMEGWAEGRTRQGGLLFMGLEWLWDSEETL